MTKRLFTQLVDDIDDIDGTVIGDESGETIESSLGGVDYAIDLKTKNASEFHRKMEYYIERATRVGGRNRTPSPTSVTVPAVASSGTGATRDRAPTTAIRQWASDNGYDIVFLYVSDLQQPDEEFT